MYVAGLWRYPVKSLGGEPLQQAELTAGGVRGDRLVHVAGARGVITGRSRSGLLTIPAGTGPDGAPLVAGYPWSSEPAAALVAAQAGEDARLVAYPGPERFDVLNLLVATDEAVGRFGGDIRRLRPNLLIAGVDASEAETTWPGAALLIGEAVIGVHSLRQRCVVTTIDPDSGEQDVEVLRRIRREFAGELALNCWVITPGRLRLDDPVAVVPTDAQPDRIGGWIVGAPYRVSD